MPEQRKKLKEEDLISLLRKEEYAAYIYQLAEFGVHRTDALQYYMRQPYGDEQEGASQIVTSEFQDTIESIMPSMMRIFAGTETAVEFAPSSQGEEQAAKEATDYVPHVLMRENEGYRILYWLIKDALMFRLSGATVDLEDTEQVKTVPVHGITQDALDLLESQTKELDAEFETDLKEDPLGSEDTGMMSSIPGQYIAPQKTFTGTLTTRKKAKKVVVDNIAYEDILFTPMAREQDKASFLGYRKRVTASDLVVLGMKPDDVDELRSERPVLAEEYTRDPAAFLAAPLRDTVGDSERPIWLVQAYLRADMDGDGISEMYRCVYAHAGGAISRLVDSEEWDGEAWITLACPILMSHVIVGQSLFDQTQDLQQIGTALTRGMLDNLYLANRPRPVVSDQVNLDSLIDWVPGSPIRLKPGAKPGDNHVQWMTTPPVMDVAIQAMEYFQTIRENRTGIIRNNQGLDPDTLNRTTGGTASGLNMLMGAGMARQEFIARTLAETAIKRLYRIIYRAIKKAASGPMQYWAGQSFRSVDPTQWPDDMDLSVNVGAGTKDQAVQALAQIAAAQEKLVLLQGNSANGPWVTVEGIANVVERLQNALGYKTPGLFFQPPEMAKQAAAQMAQNPPPPDPKVQAEQARAQADMQAQQAKSQADMQRIAAQMQMADQKHQAEMQKLGVELQIARENHDRDMQTHNANMQAKQADHAHQQAMAQFQAMQPRPAPGGNA